LERSIIRDLAFVSTPKDRMWSEDLYKRAVEFHGHGGPFMVIGLMMGLTALDMLDAKGWFGIRCRAMLCWRPPDSCVLDGIQISTGCTTGKHNLEVVELDGVAAEFKAGEKTLLIKVRDQVLVKIGHELEEEDHEEGPEELIDWLKEMPREALFEISMQ
jgi:formylmethanofuran dehydrogenase subunit E